MYTINENHDVWFWTEFFDILDHFLPFDPPNNMKNQNFENDKTTWRYYFTLGYQIISCIVPEI